MRNVFGWSLPPGVTNRMIEEQCEDHPCQCCGNDPADCICPECPYCGEQGNPECYHRKHNDTRLRYNKAQLMGQARMTIGQLKARIVDEEMYIAWLEQQPEDWQDE